MTDRTCTLEECAKPVKRKGLCYGHYMKQWRYGDPRFQQTFEHEDLTGRRFGKLTVVRRADGMWRCACACGADTTVRIGDLKRGTTQTCGNRKIHHRRDDVGTRAAHDRVRTDRGPATDYACTDCGRPAAHWSYDHRDPDERTSPEGYPYSLNTEHYEPRCVPCHKHFDLNFLGLAAHQGVGPSNR